MSTINAQKSPKIAVIGLGYVGLPLAVEFAKHYPVAGFDIKQPRIDELNAWRDSTLETEEQELKSCITRDNPLPKADTKGLFVTTNLQDLAEANIYIVTVPTPTDKTTAPI